MKNPTRSSLLFCALLVCALPAVAQGRVNQRDIEIDPEKTTVAKEDVTELKITDASGEEGHGKVQRIRKDVATVVYGICDGANKEIKEVLYVMDAGPEVRFHQPSDVVGTGGVIEVYVDGSRLGYPDPGEQCRYKRPFRGCQRAGLPGELAGSLARMHITYMDHSTSTSETKIDLKVKRRGLNVCS